MYYDQVSLMLALTVEEEQKLVQMCQDVIIGASSYSVLAQHINFAMDLLRELGEVPEETV